MVPERLTNALTTIFHPLFVTPVVVVVLAMIALDVWLLAIHDGTRCGSRPLSCRSPIQPNVVWIPLAVRFLIPCRLRRVLMGAARFERATSRV